MLGSNHLAVASLENFRQIVRVEKAYRNCRLAIVGFLAAEPLNSTIQAFEISTSWKDYVMERVLIHCVWSKLPRKIRLFPTSFVHHSCRTTSSRKHARPKILSRVSRSRSKRETCKFQYNFYRNAAEVLTREKSVGLAPLFCVDTRETDTS
jgi:hypothetical protein